MESLTELYKTGRGPSSSHTIGPEHACKIFKNKNSSADHFKAILFGSLAKTGEGHGSDMVIKKTFQPIDCSIEFDYDTENIPHPNTMELIAYKDDTEIDRTKVYSIGGGSILFEGDTAEKPDKIYSLDTFEEIAKYCEDKSIRLWEYAVETEADDFTEYMYTST